MVRGVINGGGAGRRAIDVGDRFARQNAPILPERIISIPKVTRTIPTIAEPVKISPIVADIIKALPPVLVPKVFRPPEVPPNSPPVIVKHIAQKEDVYRAEVESKTITQPPDYTPYSTGASKPRLIPQDGLAKRNVDTIAVKKVIEKRSAPVKIPPILKEIIKVLPPVLVPEIIRPPVVPPHLRSSVPVTADHTDYPAGNKKSGLVPQTGLTKRAADINSQKKTAAVISVKGNPIVKAKVSSEGGFLFYVDKFFIWLNRIIGD